MALMAIQRQNLLRLIDGQLVLRFISIHKRLPCLRQLYFGKRGGCRGYRPSFLTVEDSGLRLGI